MRKTGEQINTDLIKVDSRAKYHIDDKGLYIDALTMRGSLTLLKYVWTKEFLKKDQFPFNVEIAVEKTS